MSIERTPRQIRLLTALLLFGTFVLGAVAGAGLTRWTRFAPPPPRHAPFLPGPLGALKLTPEQEAKARIITDRYRPELDVVWRESMPKVKVIIEKMEKELREVLTPEQQKTLDEIKTHLPPLGSPMGPGGPPPHAGPPGGPHPGGPPPGDPPPWPPGFAPPPPPPPGDPPQ
jgi:hypothetical protein